MALGASFEHLANATNNPKAKVLGTTIDTATERYLMENRAPSRKAGELDNRGTHVYVAAFWAQALAEQTDDAELAAHFAPLAEAMNAELDNVIQALNDAQGNAVVGWVLPARCRQGRRRHASGGHVQRFARSRWRLNSDVDGLTTDRMQHEALFRAVDML